MYSRWPISVLVRPSPTRPTTVCSDAVRLAQPWVARAGDTPGPHGQPTVTKIGAQPRVELIRAENVVGGERLLGHSPRLAPVAVARSHDGGVVMCSRRLRNATAADEALRSDLDCGVIRGRQPTGPAGDGGGDG